MYWYALEPLVAVDKVKALKLAAEGKIPVLREFVARKMARRRQTGLMDGLKLVDLTRGHPAW